MRAVRAGAPIGTLAGGHGGLHLGVRAEDDPFGYVDPMTLLPGAERPLTPVAARPRRGRPRSIRVPPRAAPRRIRAPARPLTAPVAPPPTVPVRASPGTGTVPWPAWAGLALVLSGAAGSGSIALRRRRRAGAVRRTLRTSTPD